MATANLYCARLRLEGLQAHPARNGIEALAILKTHHVSLVMTDLVMPAMDGYRLIQEIRQLPPPMGKLPILLISSSHNEHDMIRCFSAGADDYITKPFSFPVVLERMRRLLDRR